MKVNVLLFTYNQEDFISKAIESILSQKGNFELELIIANDGSTDNTSNIINSYKEKYSEKIIVVSQDKLGITANAFKTIQLINGDYIAFIDGDDYWNYEYKLQEQINFLEQNKDFNGTFHDAKIEQLNHIENNYFDAAKTYSQNYQYKHTIYPSDILKRLIVPTASIVFRKKALNNFLENSQLIKDHYSLDWKALCFLIKDSKFYYFNETWSVYRNHSKGISKSNKYEYHLSHIDFYKTLLKDNYYSSFKYDIYSSIANEYEILLEDKNYPNKKKVFRKYLQTLIKKTIAYYKVFNSKEYYE